MQKLQRLQTSAYQRAIHHERMRCRERFGSGRQQQATSNAVLLERLVCCCRIPDSKQGMRGRNEIPARSQSPSALT
jgi:hypothetical protein